MTSRLVVNNIDNHTGVTTIRLNPTYASFELNSAERVRIDSGGRLLIGTTTEGASTGDRLTVSTSGNTGMTIRSGTSHEGNIFFSDGTSGDAEYRGMLRYEHNNDAIVIKTATLERLRIDSSGRLLLGAGAVSLPKGSSTGSMDLDNGNITMCIGGNVNSTGRTNSTNKICRLTVPHYTNAEEPVMMMMGYTISSENKVEYGGGTSQGNAATIHKFYTAADTTTVTGTERLRITSSGNVNLNENVGIQTSSVEGADLVGAGTSFFGAYIGDGMLAFHNRLDNSTGYYVAAHVNALNAGPVTLGSTMTLAGTWVIV